MFSKVGRSMLMFALTFIFHFQVSNWYRDLYTKIFVTSDIGK